MNHNTFVLNMTEESWLDHLAMKYGGDFCRKVASRTETPPTPEEWAEYQEGVELLAKLEDNPYFSVEGYDADVRVDEPRPHVQVEYAETEAEYAARVRTLNPDDYEPIMWRSLRESLGRALDTAILYGTPSTKETDR